RRQVRSQGRSARHVHARGRARKARIADTVGDDRTEGKQGDRLHVQGSGKLMIWHNRFAKLVAALTVLLIAAGGMVTSTGSGLSVPDWPTTYGWNMFTFPLSKWVGGIRYEHSHRLIASTVGFLTIILAFWTWRVEPR